MCTIFRKEGGTMLRGFRCIPLLLGFLSCSCQYKELCRDHNHGVNVPVEMDWSRYESIPDVPSMSLEFVNADSRDAIDYRIPGCHGGSVRLCCGSWEALTWNETESVTLRRELSGMNADICICGRTGSLQEGTQIVSKADMPLSAGALAQRVVQQPERIWAGNSAFDLQETGEEGGVEPVRLTLFKRTTTIQLRIMNVKNIEYCAEFGAAISGLSAGITLCGARELAEAVTQAIPLQKEADGSLTGRMECFGHSPAADTPHMLTVYAVLGDGTKWYSSMDISGQMHREGNEIEVVIDNLPLPKPIVNGSGFRPEVDDWQEVYIYINTDKK